MGGWGRGEEKKIATLPNKITLHENFMMVQPIAAGNSANKSEEKREEKRGMGMGKS